MGTDWHDILRQIVKATALLGKNEVAQPVKPYLRYQDPINRIIAMPAYVGGDIGVAGIKWIASFPKNIQQNIPRAHSVIILNEEKTGVPVAVINTPVISGIRTAGVTGTIVQRYLQHIEVPQEGFDFGIIGFGPIGRLHLEMICSLFPDTIRKIYLYDLQPIDAAHIPEAYRDKVVIATSWQEAYRASKIFITCTVSTGAYIDIPPRKGTLQLNISLRDYKPELVKYVDTMIVDDWEEICRENTDIEQMHLQYGLNKEDVIEIHEALFGDIWTDLENKVVMFNPMGMAIYDMAVGKYYLEKSIETGIGLVLEA